jgi:hypothetical protein
MLLCYRCAYSTIQYILILISIRMRHQNFKLHYSNKKNNSYYSKCRQVRRQDNMRARSLRRILENFASSQPVGLSLKCPRHLQCGRRFCETVRLHLSHVAYCNTHPHAINIKDLNRLQHYPDARFTQLNTAPSNSNPGAMTLESQNGLLECICQPPSATLHINSYLEP